MKMTRLELIRLTVTEAILTSLVSLVILTLILGFLRLRDYRILTVQTSSMVPTFGPHDAVLMHSSKLNNIFVGEVITYHSPKSYNVLISHRLIKFDLKDGWLTTSGDDLKTPDDNFPPELLVGQVTAVLPELGLLLQFIRSSIGLAIFLYFPAIIIILVEVHRLSQSYTRPFYSVRLMS